VSEELADRLYDAGIGSIDDFIEANVQELMEITQLQEPVLLNMQEEGRQQLLAEEFEADSVAEAEQHEALEQEEVSESEDTSELEGQAAAERQGD
jgi:transcription termination/antitermination protein NusA